MPPLEESEIQLGEAGTVKRSLAWLCRNLWPNGFWRIIKHCPTASTRFSRLLKHALLSRAAASKGQICQTCFVQAFSPPSVFGIGSTFSVAASHPSSGCISCAQHCLGEDKAIDVGFGCWLQQVTFPGSGLFGIQAAPVLGTSYVGFCPMGDRLDHCSWYI